MTIFTAPTDLAVDERSSPPLTAYWITVIQSDGRSRLEMRWISGQRSSVYAQITTDTVGRFGTTLFLPMPTADEAMP